MNKKGFIKNFFTPELISIIRKSKFKIIILIITLLSSLVVIGIGNGAKKYVDQRMEDPFIKFIDIKLPHWADKKDKKNWRKYITDKSYILGFELWKNTQDNLPRSGKKTS